MMTVKIGANRQIIIPKKAFSALGLAAGDYLEVVVQDDTLVMVPKTLVDKGDAQYGAGRQSDGSKNETQQGRR
jgi:AbrB family looped-hinge helix DNA binding protein